MAGRTAAALAFAVLGLGLVAAVLLTTPWQPLPGPVPGGRVAADVAADFSSAELARERAFHRAVRPPVYAGMLAGLLAAGVLGLTPRGARLLGLVARATGERWWLTAALGALVLGVVMRAVALPFDIRAETVLRRYGLSTQSWGSWSLDAAKSLLLSGVLAVAGALVLYGAARAFPRTWWLPVGLAGLAITAALSFAYPLVVEPMFNKFTSMPSGALRAELLALAARDGVDVDDVLVADASRRTTALNAYVSGFGGSRRVVVYDTLLRSSTPAEVRLIVAHELGHTKNRDVLRSTLLGGLGVGVGACALWLALSAPALLRRAGVDSAADPRSLALVLFLVSAVGVLTLPAHNLVSRRVEARADVHSLELTRDATTFVGAERRLALTNLGALDPHPLLYGWFYTHPTAPERIALARSWARRARVDEPTPRVRATP